MMYKVNAVIV